MTGPEEEEFILLKRKVEDLISDYRLVQQELIDARGAKQQMIGKLESNEDELKGLKKDFEKVKLSGAILGDGDNSREAKKRINDLVREIDNCIALLNNI